jgi:exopolysaccharide biosynthesis protein
MMNTQKFTILLSLYLGLILVSYPDKNYVAIADTPSSYLQTKSIIFQGSKVEINGKTLSINWSQWQEKGIRIGISDMSLMQNFGFELLPNQRFTEQPLQWFPYRGDKPLILSAKLTNEYRYLDISDIAKQQNWQLQIQGDTLKIITPIAQIINIRQSKNDLQETLPQPTRIVIDLDRPTLWNVRDEKDHVMINIEGTSKSEILPSPQIKPVAEINKEDEGNINNQPAKIQYQLIGEQISPTNLRLKFPLTQGWRSRSFTLNNPYRLVIDITPDHINKKDILWQKGVKYKQEIIEVEKDKFPITYMELDPDKIDLQPLINNNLVGINYLSQIASNSQTPIAVNAGYFNRNTKLPLGAIKIKGQWQSNPILNRGAIAWNNPTEIKFSRLVLTEILTLRSGEKLPIKSLNTGYIENGISRYTPLWGEQYTNLTDNETIIIVENNQILDQISASIIGKTTINIPRNGYLLSIRNNPEVLKSLIKGEKVTIETNTIPSEINNYENIISAGPLLIENEQIVLDAKLENFRDNFIEGKAIRTVIATTKQGKIIIVTIPARLGGLGPTLLETAKIIEKMGANNALNLDGGSSTSLYLGGEIINRSPNTVGRVHNGIGVYLK